MRAQYLSLDALVASIIFILLIISLFSFLRFSVYSQQFYENDIDSATVYVSSLLLSAYNTDYSIIDPTKRGKYLDPKYLQNGEVELTRLNNVLDSVTPYKTKLVLTCYSSNKEKIEAITPSNIKWISHIKRSLIAEESGSVFPCNLDIYLGIPE